MAAATQREPWMRGAVRRPGAFHRFLHEHAGWPLDRRIPPELSRDVAEHPERFVETAAAQARAARMARLALRFREAGARRRGGVRR